MRRNPIRLTCCCLVVALLLAIGVPRAEAAGPGGYDGVAIAAVVLVAGAVYGAYWLVKTLTSDTPSDTRTGGSEKPPSDPGTPGPAPFFTPISPPGL